MMKLLTDINKNINNNKSIISIEKDENVDNINIKKNINNYIKENKENNNIIFNKFYIYI